jgi:hypothetical protein
MTETDDTATFLDWFDGVGDLPTDTLVPVSVAAARRASKWLREWRERALVAEDKIEGLTFKKDHAEAACEGYRKQMLFFRDRKREVEEENDNLRVDVLRLKDETDKQKALILSYEARLDKLSASDPRQDGHRSAHGPFPGSGRANPAARAGDTHLPGRIRMGLDERFHQDQPQRGHLARNPLA